MIRFTSKPLLAVFERPFAILRPSRDMFCADCYWYMMWRVLLCARARKSRKQSTKPGMRSWMSKICSTMRDEEETASLSQEPMPWRPQSPRKKHILKLWKCKKKLGNIENVTFSDLLLSEEEHQEASWPASYWRDRPHGDGFGIACKRILPV